MTAAELHHRIATDGLTVEQAATEAGVSVSAARDLVANYIFGGARRRLGCQSVMGRLEAFVADPSAPYPFSGRAAA